MFNRIILSIVVMLVVLISYSFHGLQNEKIPVKGYKLVWKDEFNGKNWILPNGIICWGKEGTLLT